MAATPSPAFPLAEANTTFFLDLFQKLNDEDKTANMFLSPLSISAALAMVMLGASGNTAAQMSEVLGFSGSDEPKEEGEETMPLRSQMQSSMQTQMQTRSQMRMQLQQQSRLPGYLRKCLKPKTDGCDDKDDDDKVHAGFAQLLSELNKKPAEYTLSVANRLYGEQSYQFIEHFLAETKKHYSGELEPVDFKTKAEEARVNINSWVEEKTEGKIKDVLAEGVVDIMTRLVLVNAIYFKGKWNEKFQEDNTVDFQFRMNKTDTKPVKMMQQKREFSYASVPEAKIKVLEMPYKGMELSMLIILPNEIEDDTTGLEKLEKELTYENFVNWTGPDMMGQSEVDVKLPRFKMEAKYDMKEVLKSMGMLDAFDVSKSNFSGMSPANDLVLSKVVHKAFVEVNEEGTEAAAVTAPIISTRSIKVTETFAADHPFLFFIRHNPSKTVLFAGRYCSPE
uniref:leukocyte elastase inhibitor-like n=1 Tax=Semicossyphus pulcher TaxID=241346 RepID=UPI0037E75406